MLGPKHHGGLAGLWLCNPSAGGHTVGLVSWLRHCWLHQIDKPQKTSGPRLQWGQSGNRHQGGKTSAMHRTFCWLFNPPGYPGSEYGVGRVNSITYDDHRRDGPNRGILLQDGERPADCTLWNMHHGASSWRYQGLRHLVGGRDVVSLSGIILSRWVRFSLLILNLREGAGHARRSLRSKYLLASSGKLCKYDQTRSLFVIEDLPKRRNLSSSFSPPTWISQCLEI